MFSFWKTAGAAFLALALISPVSAQERVITLPKDEMRQLVAIFDLIQREYINPVDDKKLINDAIAGMVTSLDSHSQYLDKDELRELETTNTGNFVGIGVEVEIDGNDIRVIAPIENSPAERAGIQSGDVIVGVDGATVNGMKLQELSKRILGAPNTPVSLVIARPSEKGVRTFQLMREPLHGDTVKAHMVAPGVAWIRISHFQSTTPAELAACLNEVGTTGDLKGVVLDLRNDPGGVVPSAVGVAAAFLPPDAVVFKTRGRVKSVDSVVTTAPRYYRIESEPDPLASLPAWSKTVPLAVLVNGGSASSAEIVAGALQDHKRGIIVGTPTFGKGSIQGVIRLSESAGIKLTIARYYTPEGHAIQATGITPDIVVPPESDGKAPLEYAVREADLPRHLPAEQEAQSKNANAARKSASLNSIEKTSIFGTDSDKTLKVALATLGKPASSGN